METYRVVLAIALIGLPAVGVLAPLVSFLTLRRPGHTRRKVRASVAVGTLLFWAALSAGIVVLFVHVTFGYAWGWAHAGVPPPAGEQMTLLLMVVAALVLLSGCGVLLHRLLVVTSRPA